MDIKDVPTGNDKAKTMPPETVEPFDRKGSPKKPKVTALNLTG